MLLPVGSQPWYIRLTALIRPIRPNKPYKPNVPAKPLTIKHFVKSRLSGCKRPPFRTRKAAFHKTKDGLSQNRQTAMPDTSVTLTSETYDMRRFYRSSTDRIIGGVCGGIAEYFNIDPLLVRIAFAFLVFGYGTGFLVYILLWILAPKAY